MLLSLLEKYGTPIYILNESRLLSEYIEIQEAFSNFPFPVKIAYPYKTNSFGYLCNFLHKKGIWAEVSSILELQKAIDLNIKPQYIVYNSAYKSNDDLHKAISIGCKIHLDNFEDLDRIIGISLEERDRQIDIGIRISSSTGSNWDKFGFDLQSELELAIRKVNDTKNVRITGIHIHRSSIIDLEEYRQHITKILSLSADAIKLGWLHAEYIDIGSGFAVDFPAPLESNIWIAPTMKQYADIILAVWRECLLSNELQLIVEPGRRLVASSVSLITKVVSIKNRNGSNLAIVDGGQNMMPGIDWYRYPIRAIGKESSQYFDIYDIHGCLCDSMDILGRQVRLPKLEVGDVLNIDSVGGYDIARSFVWQLRRPPILCVDESGEIHYYGDIDG